MKDTNFKLEFLCVLGAPCVVSLSLCPCLCPCICPCLCPDLVHPYYPQDKVGTQTAPFLSQLCPSFFHVVGVVVFLVFFSGAPRKSIEPSSVGIAPTCHCYQRGRSHIHYGRSCCCQIGWKCWTSRRGRPHRRKGGVQLLLSRLSRQPIILPSPSPL